MKRLHKLTYLDADNIGKTLCGKQGWLTAQEGKPAHLRHLGGPRLYVTYENGRVTCIMCARALMELPMTRKGKFRKKRRRR